MPAVSVLPLGSTAVSSIYPSSSTDIGEKMSSKAVVEDGEGVENLAQDTNVKGKESSKGESLDESQTKDGVPNDGPPSQSQPFPLYPQALPAHLTPPQAGYYYAQTQVTPEPPSPAGGAGYDFQTSPFTGVGGPQYGIGQQQQPPSSPSQNSMGGIPPASPLFGRGGGQVGVLEQRVAPNSPGPWTDNRNPPYPPGSPQVSALGIPIPYVPGMPPRSVGGRSYSFEETMLPPSAESQQQPNSQQQQDQNPSLSPHGANQNNAPPGGAFHPQQPWGYPPSPDMYAMGPGPMRPPMQYPGPPPRHPAHMVPPYGGQFFPATSPGPPIQTTASNKGPDGANLFIFHIPNHFSNLDMYHLFSPYGNLLSVRIMVEKDSGRSRGFGFVSYDSPDSAAMAIKELNGFAIGNKRLKVQHKQIRSSEQQHDRMPNNNNSGYNNVNGQYGGNFGRMPSQPLPPAGAMSMNSAWYNNGPMQNMGMATQIGVPPAHEAQNQNNDGGKSADNPDIEGLSSLDSLRQNLPDA